MIVATVVGKYVSRSREKNKYNQYYVIVSSYSHIARAKIIIRAAVSDIDLETREQQGLKRGDTVLMYGEILRLLGRFMSMHADRFTIYEPEFLQKYRQAKRDRLAAVIEGASEELVLKNPIR